MKPSPKMQGRRPMPKMRNKTKVTVERSTLTVGDLINAAYEALGDTGAVVRVLGSNRMSNRIGRKLVIQ
jgi:hypothetical protein